MPDRMDWLLLACQPEWLAAERRRQLSRIEPPFDRLCECRGRAILLGREPA